MPLDLTYDIAGIRHNIERETKILGFIERRIVPLVPELSDSVLTNFSGGTLWFMISDRHDLEVLLRLAAPGDDGVIILWKKSPDGRVIRYSATIDSIEVQIRASDAALPPTCRTTKKTIMIAAVPETKIEVEEIVCDL